MKNAQASAELVVAISSLLLVFFILVVIRSALEQDAMDYADRAEAERAAKQYASIVNYVALGGNGTEVVVINTAGQKYTVKIGAIVRVNSSRAAYSQASITGRVDSDVEVSGPATITIRNIGGMVVAREV